MLFLMLLSRLFQTLEASKKIFKKRKFAFSIEVKDIPKKLSVEYMKFKYSLQ